MPVKAAAVASEARHACPIVDPGIIRIGYVKWRELNFAVQIDSWLRACSPDDAFAMAWGADFLRGRLPLGLY